MRNDLNLTGFTLCMALFFSACQAGETRVFNAWARTTVPEQKVGAVYFAVESPVDARLTKVETPFAAEVELHDMRVEDGVMRMWPLDAIELPAKKTVRLESGGRHVMLLDIKGPLVAGQRLPLTLTLVRTNGEKEVIEIAAEVRAIPP